MNPILSREQSQYIYRVSYLTLCSSLYAIYRHHYTLAIVPGSVFLTSIYYWKNPNYSYRRYLDMVTVISAFIYQNYMAYNSEYANIYYTISFFSVASYPIGIYYYNKKYYWESTYAHMMLHILANIANIVLYSGYIQALEVQKAQILGQRCHTEGGICFLNII